MKQIRSATLIGSGRLACHLARALNDAGIRMDGIFSLHHENASALAKKLNVSHFGSINDFHSDADLVIMAVTDAFIRQLANELKLEKHVVVHTSGTVDMDALKGSTARYGVFYPLQTFTTGAKIDFRKVPVCIEGNNPVTMQMLVHLAGKVSLRVYEINSLQRKQLHLAAVFASNFSNYMYVIAREILDINNLSPELLQPLLEATVNNFRGDDVFGKQTGPAIREDKAVMRQHINMLKDSPDFAALYKMISKSIVQRKKKHG